ncbi:MAG: hypothetical protein R2780_12775 [Crocinitomicaceae bacterium]
MSDNIHYQKGLDKIKDNQFEEAIEHLTNAIADDNTNPFFFNHRAVCYLNLEKFELSMFDMNKSIELDDNYAYFYSCRAFLKSRIKDLEGCIADYERSLQLDPENEITYNNMGLALESLGRMNQAQYYYNEANKILDYDPSKRKLSEDGTKMVDRDESEIAPENEVLEKPKGTKVAKEVFTKKSTFKEFLGFIGNGFKLKDPSKEEKHDKS